MSRSESRDPRLRAIPCIWYVWRRNVWPLREVISMWREAAWSPAIAAGEVSAIFGPRDQISEFFAAVAHRAYEEATNWWCVYGCCVVVWDRGKRGNMGGYGPAGCPCDDLEEPRDLARGPMPKAEQ